MLPITLKAFANSSPGLPLRLPRGKGIPFIDDATLKELRQRSQAKQSQLPHSCRKIYCWLHYPGFQSKPWAGISERFQRHSSQLEFSQEAHKRDGFNIRSLQ